MVYTAAVLFSQLGSNVSVILEDLERGVHACTPNELQYYFQHC